MRCLLFLAFVVMNWRPTPDRIGGGGAEEKDGQEREGAARKGERGGNSTFVG